MYEKQQPLGIHGKYKIKSSSVVPQIMRNMASFPKSMYQWRADIKLSWQAVSPGIT